MKRPLAKRMGEVLREARSASGRSQAEVGRLSGLEPAAVSQAENGTRLPSLGTLMKLAAGIGVRASDLVARVEAKRDR